MQPITFALATLIVAIGAAVQGAIGFGLGVFAAPLLLLFAPALVPGPLLASSLVLTLLLTHRERAGIDRGALTWALGGRVVGITAAALLLATSGEHTIALWSGGLVLFAVVLSVSGLRVRPAPRTLITAGVLSGILSTAVSIGGPPMALLYQRESGARLRGTLSAFFLVGVLLSLGGLGIARRFGLPELRLSGLLAPGILLGFLGSRPLASRLDPRHTRAGILVISTASAVLVIARALR